MFERYYRELLGFLSRTLNDRDAAADLVQESYARVYAAQQGGAAVREPRALLYQTARNLLIDHQRHREVRASVETVVHDFEPSSLDAEPALSRYAAPRAHEPDAVLASNRGVRAMVEAIDRLPPRCREAFVLNRFEGLAYADVATRMGISVKAVEQHLKNALDACDRARRATHDSGEAAVPAPMRRKLNRSRHD